MSLVNPTTLWNEEEKQEISIDNTEGIVCPIPIYEDEIL